eukprot:CAMPEP_0172202114 /NCGR_PEP_ID=MMETSP1050-20130122/30435_1 /TAXON_ID=233186 /ORGANISM="Cryptomonas curvata, Strain CCAP979/52" /LENGTH=62 /DNA_ID=CAMNT_0012879955 /DNA_START=133 /DNA_END=318 /DNA_ORIENTATION=-
MAEQPAFATTYEYSTQQQYNPYEAYNQGGQFTYQWQQPAAGWPPQQQAWPGYYQPHAAAVAA